MFLYPTLVVILSFVFLGKTPTRREDRCARDHVRRHRARSSQQLGASPEHRLFLFGALLVFSSSMCYAFTSSPAASSSSASGRCASPRIR
jgi:hypothetical protein